MTRASRDLPIPSGHVTPRAPTRRPVSDSPRPCLSPRRVSDSQAARIMKGWNRDAYRACFRSPRASPIVSSPHPLERFRFPRASSIEHFHLPHKGPPLHPLPYASLAASAARAASSPLAPGANALYSVAVACHGRLVASSSRTTARTTMSLAVSPVSSRRTAAPQPSLRLRRFRFPRCALSASHSPRLTAMADPSTRGAFGPIKGSLLDRFSPFRTLRGVYRQNTRLISREARLERRNQC